MAFQIYVDPLPSPRPPIHRSHTLPAPPRPHFGPTKGQEQSLFSILMPAVPSGAAAGSPRGLAGAGAGAGGKENLDPLTGQPARKEPTTSKSKSKSKSKAKQPLTAPPLGKPKANPSTSERAALAPKPPAAVAAVGTKAGKGKTGKRKPSQASKRALAPLPIPLPLPASSSFPTPSPAHAPSSFSFSYDTAPPLPPSWPLAELDRASALHPQIPADIGEQYDRLARDLTVLPLADVSAAYGVQVSEGEEQQDGMQLDPAQVPLPPSPTQDRVFAPISPFSVRGPGEGEGRVSPVWEPPRKRARLQEHELELGPGQGTRTSLRRARTFDCSPTTGRLQPIQRQQPLQPPVHQDPQHQQEEQDTQQQPLQGPCMPALGMTESLPIWEDLL